MVIKFFFRILPFLFVTNILAQQSVTLVSVGSGVTADQARTDALRNAIEQTYGVFISSNIEILNDEIVKDEIVTISSGNIENFDVLNEEQINETLYTSNLRVTVSVTKLTSYAQSKGQEIEFAGGLFAQNIKLQQLNEQNEIKVLKDMSEVIKSFKKDLFTYELEVGEPENSGYKISDEMIWSIPLTIKIRYNEGFENVNNIIHSTLSGISMSMSEIEEYYELGKSVYPIIFLNNDGYLEYYFLRNSDSNEIIFDLTYSFQENFQNWNVYNGVDTLNFEKVMREDIFGGLYEAQSKRGVDKYTIKSTFQPILTKTGGTRSEFGYWVSKRYEILELDDPGYTLLKKGELISEYQMKDLQYVSGYKLSENVGYKSKYRSSEDLRIYDYQKYQINPSKLQMYYHSWLDSDHINYIELYYDNEKFSTSCGSLDRNQKPSKRWFEKGMYKYDVAYYKDCVLNSVYRGGGDFLQGGSFSHKSLVDGDCENRTCIFPLLDSQSFSTIKFKGEELLTFQLEYVSPIISFLNLKEGEVAMEYNLIDYATLNKLESITQYSIEFDEQ